MLLQDSANRIKLMRENNKDDNQQSVLEQVAPTIYKALQTSLRYPVANIIIDKLDLSRKLVNYNDLRSRLLRGTLTLDQLAMLIEVELLVKKRLIAHNIDIEKTEILYPIAKKNNGIDKFINNISYVLIGFAIGVIAKSSGFFN